MEENSNFASFEIQLPVEAKNFLNTASGWALFLAIVGTIVILFSLLGSLGMLIASSTIDSAPGSLASMGIMSGATMGLLFLLFTITMFFPVLYLYKFYSSTQKAVKSDDINGMTKSFKDLKGYFLWSGILTILSIILYIVLIVITVSSASRLSGM
ncbi:hypothetical protein GCM10007424_01070 [Flavobacterium suaedae]|uniref:DUF5362 domain-containing protein n=1 Tax=Flavobacterium suaedae TaxID=1767027 RepID=A0ABQ1JE76_9FLAO|nr:hypothetical protein [Flavobacterium suaedae]GGB64955.1 hypothetical protein GCM10007424_01070 [Flavobacterium suaedae]